MIWSISLAAPPQMSRQPEKGTLDQRVLGGMRTEQVLRDGSGIIVAGGRRAQRATWLEEPEQLIACPGFRDGAGGPAAPLDLILAIWPEGQQRAAGQAGATTQAALRPVIYTQDGTSPESSSPRSGHPQ